MGNTLPDTNPGGNSGRTKQIIEMHNGAITRVVNTLAEMRNDSDRALREQRAEASGLWEALSRSDNRADKLRSIVRLLVLAHALTALALLLG